MTTANMLDLSLYLPPVSAEQVFASNKPLALDIGAGSGEFLLALSKQMADFNHIGIEIKLGRVKKAVKAAEKTGAKNLKFVHFDANLAVGLFARETFDRVFINFPDPWPKDRHWKHRIINPEFVSLLGAVVKKGGRLEIASDHDGYFAVVEETVESSGLFHKTGEVPARKIPETRFEKMFRMQGLKVKRIVYEKNQPSAGGLRRQL